MSFGDLKTQSGLQTLNDFLQTKSYIEGFHPSTADKVVFEALAGPPSNTLHHALRWYNHIKSFGDDRKKFAQSAKDTSFYVQNVNSKSESKDDDDDIDLFDSDDGDEDVKERVNEQILKAYEEKKAKKPGPVAKSSVILEVKPWTDETDMQKMEECVRSITADGLVWGVSKLEPVGFGIHKLKICCVVEDEKVSIDWLQETIQEFEEHVQSADVAAFNKI